MPTTPPTLATPRDARPGEGPEPGACAPPEGSLPPGSLRAPGQRRVPAPGSGAHRAAGGRGPAGRARSVLVVGAVHAGSALLHLVVLALMVPPDGAGVRERLLAWDAGHFVDIARDGYPAGFTHGPDGELTGNELAFFPLYPLLVRALAALTGLDAGTAAVATAHLALAAALFAVHALLARLYGDRVALAGIALLAGAQPMALTFLMGYSESLFLALAAGTLLALHRRAWLTAGWLALLCGLTRPAALAVALAVAVAAAQHLWGSRRLTARPVAAVVLACAGTPAYLAWVGARLGRVDAWFRIQQAGWGTRWDHGAAFARFLGETLRRGEGWVPVSTAVLVLAVLGATAAAWGRGAWPPLLVYGTAMVVLAVGQSNYYHCKLRLLAPAVVFLVPAARALAGARPRTAAGVLAGAVLFGCWYGAYMVTAWPYAI
ncbi:MULTISPECIES: hypothetical protein [Streptomyces]|uniref:Mannosyltransferase (PIG-V) n=1 Tax=Streptomyces rubrolavendulae TaxID=285473 RepID=A0A1D8GAU5_9ACTN|nr:hypothetical protein [Streptomyces rubrolavendulae]AOT62566.1 hypothetical protein A4G23_05465 [Streptomyces rubrolavendulae]